MPNAIGSKKNNQNMPDLKSFIVECSVFYEGLGYVQSV